MEDRTEAPESRVEPLEGPQDESPSTDDQIESEAAESPCDGVTLVADQREPDQVRMWSLKHPDVDNWTEEILTASDLAINGIGFERKTPSDFASSITEGRMVEQAEMLAEAYDHAYLLIEGDFADFEDLDHSRLNPQSMRGMAASLTARYGIPVVPTGGDPGTVEAHQMLIDYAVRVARKHTEEPVSSHLPTGPVGSDEPAGKRMWACLDGVGPELAERLYDHTGSPVDMLQHGDGEESLIGWLMSVDGIGEKTAEKMITELVGDV